MNKTTLLSGVIAAVLILGTIPFTTLNAQTVLETGTFSDPISEPAIIYASLTFIDVNENGNYDAAFTLSEPEIQTWGDYSAAIAFYSNIEVRNGTGFTGNSNENNVAVEPGQLYHFWIDIDPVAKTYTTWVQTHYMPEPVRIFANAAFRNENITAIERWSTLNNPLGEPDRVEVSSVLIVDEIGKLPPAALYLPGGPNGNNSNVAIPPLNISQLPVTVEMWYKPDLSQPYYSTLWYNRGASSNSGVQYDRWIDTEKIKGVWNAGSGDGLHPNKPVPGEWNHVALVMTENTKILYLNGVPFEQPDTYTNYPFDGITYLGWDEAIIDRTLKGLIDEVRIWTTARTAQELEDHKNMGLSGNEAGLLGYWNFNSQTPQAIDITGNGRNGTITGGHHIDLTDATLSVINLSNGSLNEPFDALKEEYSAELPSGITSVTITAETSVMYGAKVDIVNNGVIDVSSGSAEATITVTAADDQTTKTYTLLLEVIDETTDATLSDIRTSTGALDPVFHPEQESYQLIVPVGANSVEIEAVTNIENATVAGDGTITISEGVGLANLEVTAEDGVSTKTYTIEIIEADGLNYAISLPGENGNNSHIDISGLPLSTLPYTIEMWIKPDGHQTDNSGLLYHRGTSQAGVQYASGWQGSGKLRLMTSVASDDYGTVTDVEVTPGEWHHIAAVVTQTSSSIYLNGTEYSRTVNNPAYDFSSGKLYIGWDSDNNNRTFKGVIDEVRVWNSARTAQEIENNKFSIFSGNESGLAGYWNFDLPNHTQAVDLSAERTHGLIQGGTYVVSSLFTPMEYEGAITLPVEGYVNQNTSNNLVMKLEVNTRYQLDPLHLTELLLNASGTSNLEDITQVKVFATGKTGEFSTANMVAHTEGTPEDVTFSLALDQPLEAGINYFWVTFNIAKEAANGNHLTLICESLTIQGHETLANTPEVVSPGNHLTINPDLFINHHKFPIDIVTDVAASSVEGANFASFQQNAIMTYNGYQYVTYWNRVANVCLARKKLPDGEWEILEFTDHTVNVGRVADNHYTISMGICKNDGTIHLSYDHHNTELRYKRSVPGLANHPEEFPWTEASFGPKVNYLVTGTPVQNVTYPRFISKPDGDLIFECRIGWSGSGDSFIWEYSGENGAWNYIGEYLHGTTSDENAYINGMHYDPNGRLHVSFIWRRTPNPLTNHDIYYAYSDDDGRTWYNISGNHIGTVNSSPMTLTTPGLKIWDVSNNRGLINQESQAVDSKGRIHILQSYMPDHLPNSNDFWGSRINNGYLRHIFVDDEGVWHNTLIAPSGRNRSEIAVDANDNVYVVGGNYRVYFAAASNNYQTWTELDVSESNTGMNEGLIDRTALLYESVLSFVFAHSDNDGKIIVPYYQLENAPVGTGIGLRISIYEDEEQQVRSSQYLDEVNISLEYPGIEPESGFISIEGEFETIYAEPYTLYLSTSENIRVEINDKTVLETGEFTNTNEFTIQLPHVPFHKNRIIIEGPINTATSTVIQLKWESDSQEKTLIPLTSLYAELDDPSTNIEATTANQQGVQYFPNPFSSSITLLKNGTFNYQIHNINGILVQKGEGENRLELGENLVKGVYFVTVFQKGNGETIKIVKR